MCFVKDNNTTTSNKTRHDSIGPLIEVQRSICIEITLGNIVIATHAEPINS